jgi:hypothetical protein
MATPPLPPTPLSIAPTEENKSAVKKSIWHGILLAAIIASGGSALLAVVSLLLLVQSGSAVGWGGIVLGFIVLQYVEWAIDACAALFLTYCLLYFLKWRSEGYAFSKTVLVFGILAMLPIGARIYSGIMIHNAQTAFDKANPIVVGVQPYDFSQDVIFHTSGLSLNGDIRLAGKTVLWSEVTKVSPPYPRNVTDLFAFSFDPEASKGVVGQATHFDKAAASIPYDVYKMGYVVGGKAYWIQGQATGGRDSLEEYDPVSGAQEELLKGDVIFLEGGNNNYLLLSRPITKPNGYSGTAVSLYDIATKTETPIDEWSGYSAVFGDGYFCHATKNNSIGIYDLNTKKESIVSTAATDKDLGYGMTIAGCSRSYAVYTFARASKPGTPAVWETHLLKMRDNGATADELMNIPSSRENNHLSLVDNYLFFADDNVIYRKDLSTGDETQIVSSSRLGPWDTDGTYLAYAVTLDKGVALHLQKVAPSPAAEPAQKVTLGQNGRNVIYDKSVYFGG